jgi:hypothetical protein
MVSGGYVGHGSAHHAAQVLPQDQLIRQAQQHAFLAGQRDMQMQQQQQWSTQQLMSQQQQQQQWAQQQWTPQQPQQQQQRQQQLMPYHNGTAARSADSGSAEDINGFS